MPLILEVESSYEKAMKDQAFATNPKIATLAEVKEMTLASIKKAR